MPPGVGLGVLGSWGQKLIFSEHGHWSYQIEGDDEDRSKILPYGQTGDLGVGSNTIISFESWGFAMACHRPIILV